MREALCMCCTCFNLFDFYNNPMKRVFFLLTDKPKLREVKQYFQGHTAGIRAEFKLGRD